MNSIASLCLRAKNIRDIVASGNEEDIVNVLINNGVSLKNAKHLANIAVSSDKVIIDENLETGKIYFSATIGIETVI